MKGNNVKATALNSWADKLRVTTITAVAVFAFGGPFNLFAQVQTAPGGQTRVDQAGNGVPVIRISAPNQRGVSHNRYTDYNVGREGQILNNSQTTTQTQLGGYVLGNSNLQPGQSARIILNEVTSTNRSQLQGYMEVAGPAAQVIIANPNGITCDGCGFINTTRGTLTTGTPIFGGDGSLSAFQVGRGVITIEGAGLGGNNIDRVDILARAVQINAGLWAKEANVITGANRIDYETLATQAIQGEGDKPGFGLDVVALGGMYAGKIRLVGTEAGVGVRSAGELIATGGDFTLNSAGDVQLTGRTAANAGNLAITTGSNASLAGATAASGNLAIAATNDVVLSGQTHADGDLSVAAGNATISGATSAGQSASLTAQQRLTITDTVQAQQVRLQAAQLQQQGRLLASGDITAQAGTLDNSGLIAAGVNAEGGIGAAGKVRLSADGQLTQSGTVLAGQSVALQGAQLRQSGQVQGNSGIALSATAGNIDNSGGQLNTQGTLTASASGTLANREGSISAQQLALSVNALDNREGELIQTGNGALTLQLAGTLDNTAGRIAANAERFTVDAGSLRNAGGRIEHAGSDGTTIRSRGELDNSGGLIVGNGALTVQADGRLSNRAGQISGVNATTVRAGTVLDNTQGTILGEGDVSVAANELDNSAGQIAQRGNGTLSIQAGTVVNGNDGLIAASDRATLRVGSLTNAGGVVYAQNGLAITAIGSVSNAGGVLQSGAALDIAAGQTLDNSAGQIDAKGATTISANTLNNQGGRLVSDSDHALQVNVAGTLDNQGGTLGNAGGDARINAAAIDNRASNGTRGRLIAGRDLSVTATTLNNAGGQVFAERDLRATHTTVDNSGGEIGAGNTATVQADTLVNNSGRVVANQADLTLRRLENNAGDVSGQRTLAAQMASLDGNGGRLFGHEQATIRFTGDYTHSGAQALQSNGQLTLNVDGTLTNQATLEGYGGVAINAGAVVNSATGRINSSNPDDTGVTAIQAGRIDNAGRIEGDGVSLTAADVVNTGTVIGSRVYIEADRLTNGRDLGDTLGTADFSTGFIGATGWVDLVVAQQLDNLDAEIYALGDIYIGGRDGNRTGLLRNRSGRISAEGDVDIAAETLINERRVFETQWRTLSAAEQAQNSWQENALPRYRYDDPDPLHQPPNVEPWQVISAEEIARADVVCRANAVEDRVRCIGYPNGVGSATIFQSIRTNTVTAVSQIARTSAASEIKAGGDLWLDSGSVLNDKSMMAAGGSIIINALAQSGQIDGGVVTNIAWTPQAQVNRSTSLEVRQQYLLHDPRRWVDGDYWVYGTDTELLDIAISGASKPWWVTLDPGPSASASITAGQGVYIDAHDVNNVVVGQVGGGNGVQVGGWNVGGPLAPGLGNTSTRSPQVVGTPSQPLPNYQLPSGGLFQVKSDNSQWLVESDPRFADYGKWLGSGYLLDRLGYDPDQRLKRLGDDYYETQLVLQQITGLTGRKYLGESNGLDQYRALMDAGVETAGQWNLAVGIALTAEQMAALTQDIVWMVEQEIGGQKVLVPVVYLSQASADQYRLEGASIAANTVSINASGAVNNQGGAIRAADGLSISAGSIRNEGGALTAGGTMYLDAIDDAVNRNGQITGGQVAITAGRDLINETKIDVLSGSKASIGSAGDMSLQAGRDLTTTGANITAGGAMALEAGRDLNVQHSQVRAEGDLIATAGRDLTVTSQVQTVRNAEQGELGRGVNSQSGTTQGIELAGLSAGGSLVLAADRDVNLTAAQLQAGNEMAVIAGRDINSGTLTTTDTAQQQRKVGSKRVENEQVRDETLHGSRFDAKGDLALQAGQDITLTAATVVSKDGGVGLVAGRDVSLLAGQEEHVWELDSRKTRSGIASKERISTHDKVTDSLAVGTVISGESVGISAGRDLTTRGAQVIGTGDVALAAGRHIDIGTAQDTRTEEHDKSKSKSGLMSGAGGGLSVTVGQRKQTTDADIVEVTNVGSVIGSVGGRVDIQTRGGDVTVTGSDIISATGTSLMGQNVTIAAAENSVSVTERQTFRQSGLNVSLKGGAADSAATAMNAAQRTSEVENDRLKALYVAQGLYGISDTSNGVQAGMAGYDGQAVGGNVQRDKQGNVVTDASGNPQAKGDGAKGAANASGVSLRIGVGSTRSESETRYSETTASASNIRSGGDVVIAATGDGQGNGGDINIIGSHVAGENVGLLAQRDINILSAQEVREQKAKNKAMSGEVGVTLGAEAGIGVYVSASMAEGKGKGLGTSYAESSITANNTLTAVSGRDLTIEGGQLYGDRIVANVGRDLTITSQQDRDDYERKDWSGSVDVAVGYGGGSASVSYNESGIDSTYRSVNEQSGMQAGSGGFQINVEGHTQLNGAALASSADPSKNLLSTGSLGVTELHNKAEYDAYSVGFSVSAGTSGGSVSPNLSIPQHDSKSSTTKSGIADGTVIVRDGDSSALAQVERGITELQQEGIKEIFDERKVAENMEMGRVGMEVGFRAAGDIAGSMQNKANQELEAAKASGDPAAIAAAQAKVDTWSEGGAGRTALHGLTAAGMAALGGGDVVGGVLGAVGNQLAFNAMSDYLVNELKLEKGSDEYNALIQMGSLAIGAAVGGGTGAATALSATQNNYLTHQQAELLIDSLEKCERKSGGCSDQERNKIVAEFDVLSAANTQAMKDACSVGGPECQKHRDAMELGAKAFQTERGSKINGDVWNHFVDSARDDHALSYGLASTLPGLPKQEGTALDSLIGDMLPWIGTAKSAIQLWTGKDAVTGEDVNRFWEGIGLTASILPFGKLLPKAGEIIVAAKKSGNAADAFVDAAKTIPNSNSIKNELISGLPTGTKISPEDVVDIRKLPDGRTVWLETGNDAAGLQHIYNRHEVDFINKGVSRNDIPTVVMNALEHGKVVGTNGSAKVYRVMHNGVEQNIAIGIGSNGFVVRANPVSSWRPLP